MSLARAGIVAGCLALSGCVFEPIDHEGQPPPCAAGFTEVDGRCVRSALDAGAIDGASFDAPGLDASVDDAFVALDAFVMPDADLDAPGLDARADDARADDAGSDAAGSDAPSCMRACSGDLLVDCDASMRAATCSDATTSVFCDAGALRTVRCASSCAAATGRCDPSPVYALGAAGTSAFGAMLGALVVPAGRTYTIDTDSGEIRDGATVVRDAGTGVAEGISYRLVTLEGVESALFAVERVRIEGTLVATGSAALVIVAQSTFDLRGTIDVSANAEVPGPGGGAGAQGRFANAMCSASTLVAGGAGAGASGLAMDTRASGGGGGSLGSRGGNAGAGGCGSIVAAGTVPAEGFFGGGGGGAGGDPLECDGSGANASGGGGGGLLYVVSAGVVRLAGTIDACGGRGAGGGDCGGGGGGGSGGYVAIDATEVELVAGHTIAANGGGGGAGGGRECIALDTCSPTPPGAIGGEDGVVGRRALGEVSTDARGGDGSSTLGVSSAGVVGVYNGGGGGGGAGRVLVHAHAATGTLSASPSTGSGLAELRLD